MDRFIVVWVLALLSLYISFTWFRVVGMAYSPKNISPGKKLDEIRFNLN